MVILNSAVDSNVRFVSKLLKEVHQTSLKRSLISDTETLVCHDSLFILQRKLAQLSREGIKGKIVFLHGFDANTLFEKIIRDTIIYHYVNNGYTVNVFLVAADIPSLLLDPFIEILANANVQTQLVSSFSNLQSQINSGKYEKTVVLNFDKRVHYVSSDLFVYMGIHLTPCEMRSMFQFSTLDNLGSHIIIDTLAQRIDKHTKFIGKNKFGIQIQNTMTYFPLKNCPIAGKTFCQIMHKIMRESTSLQPTTNMDDESGEEEETEDDDMTRQIQTIINQSFAVFIDRETDNYLLNFFKQHIGQLKNIQYIHNAWFHLNQPCMKDINLVCFIYTRSTPDFRDLATFANAWKSIHQNTQSELICIVLISPVLEKSTVDSLSKYKSDLNELVKMASNSGCCTGLHCEQTLLRQYVIDDCGSEELTSFYGDVTQMIMKIFETIERFVRRRENEFEPVFQERDLVAGIDHFKTDFNEDIIASFLYRAIPFIGNDGTMKVVIPLHGRSDLFVVKNDHQKYVNVSTLTGIDFSNAVSNILNELHEEYNLGEKKEEVLL